MLVAVLYLLSSSAVVVTSHGRSPSPCGSDAAKVIGEYVRQTDGSVLAEDGTRFPAGCFWESPSASNTTILQGCEAKVTCLWKCCPRGHLLNSTNKCVRDDTEAQRFNLSSFHILTGIPCIGFRFKLEADEILEIEEDGGLLEKPPDKRTENRFQAGSFCLGTATNSETVALVCDPEEDPVGEEGRYDVTFVIYTVARIIALPFMIATVVVYVIIPELRNLQGKCLISHVTSLAVAYVFLIVITVGGGGLSTWLCITSALITYFFLLGSFFWLNVMCFDIWWTFSGHRKSVGSGGSSDHRTFMFYSLYAWGGPVLMLTISLVIELSSEVPDAFLKPELGTVKCWFKDKITVLAYFTGPVGFLIFCNVVFFATTAVNIFRAKKHTSNNRRSDHHKNNERRFVLYLKLFLVMGVTWSLDLIGWVIGGPDYIWWLIDIVSILQGVLIFFIFVWKKRIRRLLRKRFGCQSQPSPAVSVVSCMPGSD